MKSYVVGFLFSFDCTCKKGCPRVALIKKNRPDWQKGLLNGIGGKVEPREHPQVAMRREFWEETGLDFADWHLFMVQESPEEKLHFYVGVVTQETLRTVKTTTDEVVGVYHIDTICDMTHGAPPSVPNLKWELHLALAVKDAVWPLRVIYPAPSLKGAIQ